MPSDCELKKLRQIQLALEKADTWTKVLQVAGLTAFAAAANAERQKEDATVRLQVAKIVKPLNEIKTKLADLSNVDLDALKKDMIIIREDIFNCIHSTKSKLKELHEKELDLSEELKYCQALLPVWQETKKEDLQTVANFKVGKARAAQRMDQENSEVQDFTKFIQKTKGIKEGWDAKYHCMYLKMKGRYKVVEDLAVEFHKQFPDKSEEDVVSYDCWYHEYLQLKEKQKQAIQNWRSSKKIDPKDEKYPEENSVGKKTTIIENREEIKEKLAIWKREQAEKIRSEEETMMVLQEKWRQMKECERVKKVAVKKDVLHWKSMKLAEEEAVKLEKLRIEDVVRKQKVIEANRLIKEYREQDKPFVERLRKFHTLKDKLNERVVPKSSVIATRDPDRLLWPTKQWQARTKRDEDENAVVHDVYDVRTIKKLGIPIWRKSM